MNKFEGIGYVVISLVERYGVTLCEIPNRFKEKVHEALDEKSSTLLDEFFEPLENDLLTSLRSKSAHSIDISEISQIANNIVETLSLSFEDAVELTDWWAKVMGVTVEGGEIDSNNLESTQIKLESPCDDYDVFLEIPSEKIKEDAVKASGNKSAIDTPKYSQNKIKKQLEKPLKPSGASLSKSSSLSSKNIVDKSASSNLSKQSHQKSFNKPSSKFSSKDNKSDSHARTSNLNQSSRDHKRPMQPRGSSSNLAQANTKTITRDRQKQGQDKDIKAAFQALGNGNSDKAAKIMMQLANSGNRRAQFHLGEFYLKGTGVDKNTEKAKYWFTKSAKNGFVRAITKLEELNENDDASGSGCCLILIFLAASLFMKSCGSLL